MKIFLLDFKNIFLKKRSLFLLSSLVLILLAGGLFEKNTAEAQAAHYKAAYSALQSMEPGRQYEAVKQELDDLEHNLENTPFHYTENPVSELLLLRQIKRELDQVHGYKNYVRSAIDQENRSSISIFQKASDYSKSALAKTIKIFRTLEDIEPRFTSSQAFLHTVDSALVSLLLLAALCLYTAFLVFQEQMEGLLSLYRTTRRGRRYLGGIKTVEVWVMAWILVFLFENLLLLLKIWQYGSLDFQAPIQSVYSFGSFPFHLNIGQYWFCFLAVKSLIFSMIGSFLLLVSIKISSYLQLVFIGTVVTAACWLIQTVPGTPLIRSWLNLINPLSFIQVTSFLKSVLWLPFFSRPVPWIPAQIGWIVLLTAILSAAFIYLFSKDEAFSRQFSWFHSFSRKKRKYQYPAGLFAHLNRFLFLYSYGFLGALLVFCLSCALQAENPVLASEEAWFYQVYIEQLSGAPSPNKESFLEQEAKEFERIDQLLQQKKDDYENGLISQVEYEEARQFGQNKLRGRSGFEKAREQYFYAQHKNVPIISLPGYEFLFGLNNESQKDQNIHILLILLCLIPVLVQFQTIEYQTGIHDLIQSAKNGGRKFVISAALASAFFGVLLSLAGWLPSVVNIISVSGIDQWQVPLAVIPVMETHPLAGLPLWMVLFLVLFLRTAGLILVSLILLAVSRKIQSPVAATITGLIIFALPAALAWLSVSWLNGFDFNAVLSGRLILFL